MLAPKHIELVGSDLILKWPDGQVDFLPVAFLRANSPSAEVAGEVDVMGVRHGGEASGRNYAGVQLLGWQAMGNYALRLQFSDGHNTGLYSFSYLRELAVRLQ